ncbi:hypothetical protein GCM10027443_08640 [Pontibacter brevis]
MPTNYMFIHLYLLHYLFVFLFASRAEPSTARVKILSLGNSVTQGTTHHPGYRHRLWQKLIDAGIDAEFVGSHDVNYGGDPEVKNRVYKGKSYTNRNEGHWGWYTDEILRGRIGKGNLAQWLQTYTPDIALVHLGSNDMLRQCGAGKSVNKPCYQETIDELKKVIQQIRHKNPAVTILLAQLIPMQEEEAAHRIKELNKRLPALVKELNTPHSPVILVDQYTGFDPTRGADTWDGIHPNASGEEKMAQKWFDALKPLLISRQ